MPKKQFNCSGCGNTVYKHLSQLTRQDIVFCTLTCRNKNYQKVLPNWRPPNYKEYKYTCLCCGKIFIKNGGNHSPKKRKYCSQSCSAKHHKRKPHSEKTKAKLSLAAATQNKNYISKHPYNGPNGSVIMKSAWEVKYAAYLDSMGIGWTYEPVFILSNGYVYLPDFQLSTGDIIEIKGYMREDAQKKWELFCADYPNVNKRLLRKNDLKELGII